MTVGETPDKAAEQKELDARIARALEVEESGRRVTTKLLYEEIRTLGGRMDRVVERQDVFAERQDTLARAQDREFSDVKLRLIEVKDAANDASHLAVMAATDAREIAQKALNTTIDIESRVMLLQKPWRMIGTSVRFSANNWQSIGIVITAAVGIWAHFGFPIFPLPY